MKDKHTFSNTYESSSTTGLDSSSAFCKQITEWYLEPVLTAGAQIQPQKNGISKSWCFQNLKNNGSNNRKLKKNMEIFILPLCTFNKVNSPPTKTQYISCRCYESLVWCKISQFYCLLWISQKKNDQNLSLSLKYRDT